MSKERLKSFILFLLVATSFVLTTRIWFFPIEGLFVMPTRQNQPTVTYAKENLLKPGKLVVHTGANHTLLFNDEKDQAFYQAVLKGSNDILRDWLTHSESYQTTSLNLEKLTDLRNSESVELIFEKGMDIDNIRVLLDVEKNPWNNIKSINSIILNPQDKRLYIVDENKKTIFQFSSSQMVTKLAGDIAEIEKSSGFAPYVFLNVYNEETYNLYGDYAIAPLSVSTMPALTVKKELEPDIKKTDQVELFFGDNLKELSGGVKDVEGKVTFTDREEKTLTINQDGALEYYKFNVASDSEKYTILDDAINIATQYVAEHLGFNYDFYLSSVAIGQQGGRTSFIFSFNYKYNGMPVITNLDSSKGAVVVEILGKEVVRYKRYVRIIEETGQSVQIKTVFNILDSVWGVLNEKLNTSKQEAIVKLNDIYLAYIEGNSGLVPVWVVNVDIERSDSSEYEKTYVIKAEAGTGAGAQETAILDERDEK